MAEHRTVNARVTGSKPVVPVLVIVILIAVANGAQLLQLLDRDFTFVSETGGPATIVRRVPGIQYLCIDIPNGLTYKSEEAVEIVWDDFSCRRGAALYMISKRNWTFLKRTK